MRNNANMKIKFTKKHIKLVLFFFCGIIIQTQAQELDVLIEKEPYIVAGENSNSTHSVINATEMMFRISEIEVYPKYIKQYYSILKEEAAASVRLEPGVISIFPLFQKENPNIFRILEIYTSKEAYKAHLQTPHFKNYKISTLKMVKTLKLVDMAVLDESLIELIFKKMK